VSLAVVDIVFLVIVVLSCMMGVFRGLIKEALSLVTWIGAILIGAWFHGPLSDLMAGLIDNTTIRNISAFSILFVLTIFVGTIASNMMQKLMRTIGLGTADRTLGAVFGLLRGLAILVLILLVTRQFEFTDSWYEGSYTVPYLMELVDYLQQYFADNSDAVNETMNEIIRTDDSA
jgi:membrane protein required for colicin V production